MSDSTYYLYILYSDSLRRYYTGVSHDPELRLKYHNSNPKGWTRRGRPWRLVFTKAYHDRTSSMKAERFVKGQKSQVFIEKLVSGEYTLD
ncbi:GIY-YIG nuclease family protein [Candidatus Neomarinimicrobiota bacterium]